MKKNFLLISLCFFAFTLFIFPHNVIAQTGNLNIDMPTGFGLPDPSGGIKEIVGNFLNWLLGIIGLIALIAFVISGIQYFMATGNETTTQTAKRNMNYSIIGIIVALSGLVIIQAVDYALRAWTLF